MYVSGCTITVSPFEATLIPACIVDCSAGIFMIVAKALQKNNKLINSYSVFPFSVILLR